GDLNRRMLYELLAAGTLGLSGVGVVLAVAGAAFQQVLGVAAASLCAVLLLVPGLFFLAFSRRLASRDLALAHAASFAKGRDSIGIQDLADELQVPRAAALRVLQVAIQEGYLRGTFRGSDTFVAERATQREEDRCRSEGSSQSTCLKVPPWTNSRL